MKKIILISDNHGNRKIVDKILAKEKYDLSIHLGDSEESKLWIESRFDYAVEGNNDNNGLPLEIEFEYEGLKFLIMHGHTRSIYTDNYKTLPYSIAVQEKKDVLIHGHSHIPYINKEKNKLTVCPGSTTIPRSKEGATYALLTIDNNKISSKIKSTLML